jgi:hypothetical protein
VHEVDTSTRDKALVALLRLGINTPSKYFTLPYSSFRTFIRNLNHFICIRMHSASNGALYVSSSAVVPHVLASVNQIFDLASGLAVFVHHSRGSWPAKS